MIKLNKNIDNLLYHILIIILIIIFFGTWIYYPILKGHGGDFIAMLSNREVKSIYWDGNGLGYGPIFAIYDLILREYNDIDAMRIMYIFNLIMLIASIFLLNKRFLSISNNKWDILLSFYIWILFYPTFQALRQNNVEITEIFFISIMLVALNLNSKIVAGISLGLAASTKILPLVLVFYFLWRKNFKVVISSIITIILVLFLVAWLKNENIIYMLVNYIQSMGKPWPNSSQGNQALSGFVWREFSQYDFTNRITIEEPIIFDIHSAKIYTFMLTLVFLITIFYFILNNTGFFPSKKISSQLESIEIALILTVVLIVLPHNHVHYFILISWIYIASIREWNNIKIQLFGNISILFLISYLLLGMLSIWRIFDPLLKSIGPVTGVDIARLYSIPLIGALLATFCLVKLHSYYSKIENSNK